MALPNPTPQPGMVPIGMVQYQQASFKESISNAMKGFGELSALKLLTKSPVLKMLGGGAIAEGIDVKRRERLAAAGRDPNTGRKLTKDELFEREMRRKDLGALAEIKEILQTLKIVENDGIVRVAMVGGGVGGGTGRLFAGGDTSKQMVVAPPSDEDAYTLADEERDAEKEKEDDQDQLESEKRQQGFFSKLFGRPDRDGNGGGILSLLTSVIGGLASLGAGLISTLIGFAAPLVTGLIPVLLAGAAGLFIKNWIDGLTAKKVEDVETSVKETRMATGYQATDAQGNRTVVSAEETGKTEEELAKLAEAGTTSIDIGDGRTLDTRSLIIEQRLNKKTGNYEYTDVLGAGSTEDKERFLGNETSSKTVAAAQTIGGNRAEQEQHRKELFTLDADMANFTRKLKRDRHLLGTEEVATMLANEWNRIRDRAKNFVESQKSKDKKTRAIQAIDAISEKHIPFKGLTDGKTVTEYDAKFGGAYLPREGTNLKFSSRGLIMPGTSSLDAFNEKKAIVVTPEALSPSATGLKGSMTSTATSEPTPPSPSTPPPQPIPRATSGAADAIGDLESRKSTPAVGGTTVVQQNGGTVNNSSNAIMTPLGAALSGKDRSPMFNRNRMAMA